MTEQRIHRSRGKRFAAIGVGVVAFAATACGRGTPEPTTRLTSAQPSAGVTYVVHDTTIDAEFEAAGVAAPVQQATLSTKLMGTVTDVLVREGDRVAAGQPLVRIDARDLSAKSAQVAASIAEAQAIRQDAVAQANRIRTLYGDSAATRAQLDAAETGLARADAGVKTAQAAASELGAVTSYSIVRAPFAGIVTKRFADPGAFAAPGAPLVAIQDVSTLRISASTTPTIARGFHRGQTITALVERTPVRATIEGVVPAMAGSLYTINALVPNPNADLLTGSRATLMLPTGQRRAVIVPSSGLVREGDLTGVTVRTAQGDDRRWVRLGHTIGDMVEVTAGLQAGDRVVVPNTRVAALAGN
jgi:RND family efflux transporter MFP subunit